MVSRRFRRQLVTAHLLLGALYPLRYLANSLSISPLHTPFRPVLVFLRLLACAYPFAPSTDPGPNRPLPRVPTAPPPDEHPLKVFQMAAAKLAYRSGPGHVLRCQYSTRRHHRRFIGSLATPVTLVRRVECTRITYAATGLADRNETRAASNTSSIGDDLSPHPSAWKEPPAITIPAAQTPRDAAVSRSHIPLASLTSRLIADDWGRGRGSSVESAF